MKVSKRYPRRVGFDSGTRPEQMWKKIGWPRMDGCENCQGSALLLIHGRGTTYCVGRGREGAACAVGYPCRCDERGRHRGKGTKSQGSPLGTPHQVCVEIIQGACTGRLRKRVPYRARGAQGAHRKTGPRYPPSRRLAERVASECPSQPSGRRAPSVGRGRGRVWVPSNIAAPRYLASRSAASSQQPHSGVNVGSKGVDGFQGLVPRPTHMPAICLDRGLAPATRRRDSIGGVGGNSDVSHVASGIDQDARNRPHAPLLQATPSNPRQIAEKPGPEGREPIASHGNHVCFERFHGLARLQIGWHRRERGNKT